MVDGPERFQDESRRDAEKNDQVGLILSSHAFEHKKSSRIQEPGLSDTKETQHKHNELDLLGFVKLAANDSKRSEFHTVEEKLIVEYQRPERVRVIPNSEPTSEPRSLPGPEERNVPQNNIQSSQRELEPATNQLPAANDREPAESQSRAVAPAQDDEVNAVIVGYKKHTLDHVGRHKHPELLGGIFNIDSDSYKDQESALVKRENEERFAQKTKTYESGSVNVGPVPLVYIGDKSVTNYYESKRTKLDPDAYVKTNKGFLPIEE